MSAFFCPPSQDFEGELRKYMAVEQAVGAIPAAQAIGALSLDAAPLKAALKAEAASWKAQFARNLHAKGAADLRVGRMWWWCHGWPCRENPALEKLAQSSVKSSWRLCLTWLTAVPTTRPAVGRTVSILFAKHCAPSILQPKPFDINAMFHAQLPGHLVYQKR
jgi:hypothetical protein